jgi:hypothetical protein
MRNLSTLTWAGIALTIVFIIFLLYGGTNLRWWIMLPLAAAGLWLLHAGRQRAMTEANEPEIKLTLYLMILILVLLILRDIDLSSSLLERLKAAGGGLAV